MRNILKSILLIAMLLSVLPACTTRAWYGSMQSLAKQNCQHRPPAEQSDCEARRYKDDYDTYERQRKSL
jgi:hypothetical protein